MNKYTVFFVEDEETIREKIRDTIDWSATDFEYLGEAEDGELGLKRIAELKPDIVVTDIKMPKLGGLEMCRGIRYESPDTLVLIMSGHDDFTFAQEAIRLNVHEYLLKPLTPVNLIKALNRAALTISARRERLDQIDALRTEVDDSRALLRDRFLQRLMTGANSIEAIRRADELGMNLRADHYCVSVVRSKVYLDVAELANAVHSIEQHAFVFRIGYREAGILTTAKTEAQLAEQKGVLTTRLPRSPVFLSSAMHIAVGNPVSRLSELPLSFQSACYGVDTESAALWNELKQMKHTYGLNISEVTRFLKTGLTSDVDAFLEMHLRGDDCDRTITAHSLYIISNITFIVRDFLDGLGLELDMPRERAVGSIRTASDIRAECAAILKSAIAARNRQSENRYEDVIPAVCEKIMNDYASGDVSLNTLAKHVSVSPSYLSTLFRRVTGRTISTYITDVRIDRAKELLRTTSMRTSEISCAVGYSDPNYFNAVFKRHENKSPTQYRREK